jgi:hypothetical protein
MQDAHPEQAEGGEGAIGRPTAVADPAIKLLRDHVAASANPTIRLAL